METVGSDLLTSAPSIYQRENAISRSSPVGLEPVQSQQLKLVLIAVVVLALVVLGVIAVVIAFESSGGVGDTRPPVPTVSVFGLENSVG